MSFSSLGEGSGTVDRILQPQNEPTTRGIPTSTVEVSGALNILAEVTSYVLLFLLIFGMSATVEPKSMFKQLQNKFAICTGVGMQFVIMPFLGFLSVTALGKRGLEHHVGLTLLLVTCSPGGSYSNWWCSTFNGDLALSVAMTALSTVISAFLLPANLMLYAHAAYGKAEDSVLAHVDWFSLFLSLAVVISAIFLGLLSSYKIQNRQFQRWCNRLGSFSGLSLIIFSALFSASSGGEDVSLWNQDWSFFVGVAAPCVIGLLLANIISSLFRLHKPEAVTISIECSYQNVGIASTAAIAMFDNKVQRAEALCVPLFYGLVEAVLIGTYCVVAWKMGWTKAPANEKFSVVIGKSYEIVDDETIDTTDFTESEDLTDHDLGLTKDQEDKALAAPLSIHIESKTLDATGDDKNRNQGWFREKLGFGSRRGSGRMKDDEMGLRETSSVDSGDQGKCV